MATTAARFRADATDTGECYWAAFFIGQLVVQQAGMLAQAFFVTGQILSMRQGLVPEAQPVNPKDATQATERSVRIVFIGIPR